MKIEIKKSVLDNMNKEELILFIKELIEKEEEISLALYNKNKQGKLEKMSERWLRNRLKFSLDIADDTEYPVSFTQAFNRWANENEGEFKKTMDNYFYLMIGHKYQ